MTPRSRSNATLVVAMLLAMGCAVLAQALGVPDVAARRALFLGEGSGVRAHVAGHDEALPWAAARCVNCHEGPGAIGPRLNARQLLESQARRGGPPSRYDEATFCRLLRDGVDPAFVQLPREMPRYQIAQEDCRKLWDFLIHS
jgi:hypothetical protein